MQDGRMQIVNVDGIFDGIEAEVIGLAVDHTSSKTAACHPNAEGSIVVVSAVVATLDHRCATELAPPDDQGVFEQPEPLEILYQRGAWSIGRCCVVFDAVGQIPVLIPNFMKKLHKTHASLEQSPSE
jgi:hypothetical protein